MKPYLFEKSTDINEKSSGMGEISEATNIEVHEVLNGDYTLQFDVPKSSKFFNLIKPENLIKIRSSQENLWEVFYINKTTIKKSPDLITVSAVQYSTLSNSIYVRGNLTFDNKTPQGIFKEIKEKSDLTSQEFEYTSDFTENLGPLDISFKDSNPNTILIGDSNSLVNILDGRIERRFNKINIAKKNTGKQIHVRSGRDISGIDVQCDVSNLVTSIIPYFDDKTSNNDDSESNDNNEDKRIYGLEVRSKLAGNYANQHRLYVDYSQRVETLSDLDDLAKRYFEENKDVDKPKYTINIDTTTYSQNIQSAEIGDTALVHDSSFNLNVELPITERIYDPINNRTTNLKIGTVDSNVFQILEKRISDNDNKIDNSNDNLNKKIDDSTSESQKRIDDFEKDQQKKIDEFNDHVNKVIEDTQKEINDAIKRAEDDANNIIDNIQNTVDDTRDDLSDFMDSKGSNIIQWSPQLHNATDMRINTNYGYWLLNDKGAGFHTNSGRVLDGLSADGRVIATDIYTNTLTGTTINSGTIKSGSIESSTINSSTLNSAYINAGTFYAGKISSSNITAAEITGGTINGADIRGVKITGNSSISLSSGSNSTVIVPGHTSTPELTANQINIGSGGITANGLATFSRGLSAGGTVSLPSAIYLNGLKIGEGAGGRLWVGNHRVAFDT